MSYVKIIVVKSDALIIKLLKLFNEVTWSMSPTGITLSRSEPEVPYHSRSLGVFFVYERIWFLNTDPKHHHRQKRYHSVTKT
ncbi:hypothetical protein HA466_0317060 [Hirschfeldia incana]|nr:hypothetical protein HA466_0317060 [Hirschfeldia incana]KAJ0229334.1 hypothetical protein HA466_0317060 [Hirschfeldia incana]